jgi:hypothetical protein
MAFTSNSKDLQNSTALKIKSLDQTEMNKTVSYEQNSSSYSGTCHCFIKFTDADGLSSEDTWYLDDVNTPGSSADFEGTIFGTTTPAFSFFHSPYFPLSSPTGSFDFELYLSTNALPSTFSLDAVVTCVTGSDGVDISTGAFSNSYSLTFSRGTADNIILGSPTIGEFSRYFSCSGGGSSGS